MKNLTKLSISTAVLVGFILIPTIASAVNAPQVSQTVSPLVTPPTVSDASASGEVSVPSVSGLASAGNVTPPPVSGASASGTLTAPQTSDASASGSVTAPLVSDASASGTLTAPQTSDASASGALTAPQTSDASASGPLTVPPVSGSNNNGNTGGNTNPPANGNGSGTPANPAGSSSVSSSSFGSSGSFGSSNSSGSINISSCPLLTNSLRLGGNNNPAEVVKLQFFLKQTEGLNVAITGNFDQSTESAVKAFQTKYSETVLKPWGVTIPSGVVYFTTMKKINEIACGHPITLSADQQSEIDAYLKNSNVNGVIGVTTSTDNGTTTVGPVIGVKDTSNTAAVGNTSFARKIWNFIVRLFK